MRNEAATNKNHPAGVGDKSPKILVRCIGHEFYYPISDILRLFTGEIPRTEGNCVVCDSGAMASVIGPSSEDLVLISSISETRIETYSEKCTSGEDPLRIVIDKEDMFLLSNREVKRQLYFLLSRLSGRSFPWGSLTGIRPTQVARELSSEEEMTKIYDVRHDKAHLAFLTRDREDLVLKATDPDSLHVYIGIPFCPSRCAYCSFVAQEAPRKTALLPQYVDAVLSEMDMVLPKIEGKIETLYIGGGTPTVLSEELFEKFIKGVFSHKEFQNLKEVCVEAGRPDTITEKKLQVLIDAGVKRICINPQTLCDATLTRVGRKHTAEDFVKAFNLAGKMGFSIINTDLIAGLPEETAEEFCDSLRKIIELSPENITVHSLSKKRRSSLSREEIVKQEKEELERIEKMLSFAAEKLLEAGYDPYYMYKQKDTLGGHENVGYSKDGTECIYNVAMMSDRRSVLSFGAGGMSKRVFFGSEDKLHVRVERCPCIKDPIQYIAKVNEMAEKKVSFFRA